MFPVFWKKRACILAIPLMMCYNIYCMSILFRIGSSRIVTAPAGIEKSRKEVTHLEQKKMGKNPVEKKINAESSRMSGQKPKRESEKEKKEQVKNAESSEKPDRIRSSTAGGKKPKDSGKAPSKQEKTDKREKVNLNIDRSMKPVHRVLPYLFYGIAAFLFLLIFFNLICNFGNKLEGNPSGHWMGPVGYHLSYALFGTFSWSVLLLPVIFLVMGIQWRGFIRNRVAIPKWINAVALQILLAVLIQVFVLIPIDPGSRNITAREWFAYGVKMQGGGVLGGKIGYLLITWLAVPGAITVSILLFAASFFYFLGVTPRYLITRIRNRRALSAESRSNLSEQEAEQAKREAERKIEMTKNVTPTAEQQQTPEGYPAGAVVQSRVMRAPDDPMMDLPPMPVIERRPDDLYIPAEVGREIRKENAGKAAVKPVANAEQAAPEPRVAQANVPPAASGPVAPTPVPSQQQYQEADQVFGEGKTVRRVVRKEDRDFDLNNVFIDLDDMNTRAEAAKRHMPLPPEKPMPGARPQPGARPGTVPSGVTRTAPTAPVPQSTAKTVSATPAPQNRTPATGKPGASVFHPLSGKAQSLDPSEETLRKLDAQNASTMPPRPAQSAGTKPTAQVAGATASSKPKPYKFPPLDLLHQSEPMSAESRAELEASMAQLSATLDNFKIGVKDIGYSCGPSVTRYEITPAAGVHVKTILNLANDIALAFAVPDVRMMTIEGKNAIGIEVPNRSRHTIYLRGLLESKAFRTADQKLTAGLGADVVNNPVLFNIAKMPHLLIAGATGMGKSVCINCIIMSILYKCKPEDVRMILVDPKKVEFALYKGIPHLLAPVITEPKDATGALQAAVEEMTKRFELIQQVGCRDIEGFNRVTADDPDMPKMPYLLIIIDELADLMMTARDEVETSICRLAQLGRAAGIHLVIGTQRPSVDVVTGLIKSNIPSRIACTVASQTDSRTILDGGGAEKLLGRGDMLYAPVGSMRPTRVQGAFVSDKEVESVCDFVRRNNGNAVYDENFTSKMKEFSAQFAMKGKNAPGLPDPSLGESGGDGEDAKYMDALRIFIEEGRVSTSLLQRKLSIGYGRAAKMIDRMEEDGYVSPADGNKARNILLTKEEFIEKFVEGKN